MSASSSDPVSIPIGRSLLWPGGAAPSADSTAQVMDLAFADLLMMPFYAVRCLFFYEAPQKGAADEEFMPAERMERTFQRVLDAYPLLAGRLRRRAPDAAVQIEYGGAGDAGVEFLRARSEATLASLPLSPARYEGMHSLPASLELLQPMDWSGGDGLPRTLCSVQHTRFACGGVCIGVYIQHYLADGDAVFTLMRDWRDTYAAMSLQDRAAKDGASAPLTADWPAPPHLDRSVLFPRQATKEQTALAAAFREDLYTTKPLTQAGVAAADSGAAPVNAELTRLLSASSLATLAGSTAVAAAVPATAAPASILSDALASLPSNFCVHRVIRFSKAELAAMVAAASSKEAGCTSEWVSTFEALAGHLLRCMSRARLVSASEAAQRGVSVAEGGVAINFRSKHQPRLPEKVFANAVFKNYFNVPAESVWQEPQQQGNGSVVLDRALAEAASSAHAAIARLDATGIEQAKCWVHSRPRKDELNLRDEVGITLVSWAKFGLYGAPLSFEPNVPPVRVCFPHSAEGVDGLVTIMETPRETGGALDVYLGLLRDPMARLLRDPLFRVYSNEEKQAEQQRQQ